MEEFFLSTLLIVQELDIVHQQGIDTAVALTEFIRTAFLNGINKFIGEFFTGDIKYPHIRVIGKDLIADSVHQMGLAQTYTAVYEEGIVGHAR